MYTRNKAPKTIEADQQTLKSMYMMEGGEIIEKEIEEARLQLIEKGLNAISEECRKVLQAYYYQKLSLSEIADNMQYTYAFAKVKKFRCLQSLRNLIEAAAQHVKP